MRSLVAIAATVLLAAPAAAQSRVDLFDLLCGRTLHFYDESGNQIEYTDGEGRAFLWFHDNPRVIEGTWGVYTLSEIADRLNDGSGDEGRDGGLDSGDVFSTPPATYQVCYEYGAGGFGPLDPGGFHCFSETDLFETVVQGGVFNGDRYGLRDGEPPFTLPEHPFVELEGFETDYPELPPEPACGLPLS